MRWAWAPLQACEHQPDPNTRHTSSPQGCHDTTSRPAPTSSARSRPAGCRNGGGGGFRCRYLAAARRAPRQSCSQSARPRGATGKGRKKKETKTRPWGNILSAMRCVARTLAPCLSRGTAVGAHVRLGARAPLQSTTRPGRVGARALACRFARSCAGGGLWRRQRSAVAAAGGVSARSAGLCRRAARGEASAGGSVRLRLPRHSQHTYMRMATSCTRR